VGEQRAPFVSTSNNNIFVLGNDSVARLGTWHVSGDELRLPRDGNSIFAVEA
jgi:hypothetical protein